MKNLIHAFNVDIAQKLGLEEAIILHNFLFWIEKNKGSKKNLIDGIYWTYNSFAELQRLFPYMSDRSIKRKISSLKELGIIIIAHHNPDWSNRSNWYSVDDAKLAQVMGQTGTMSECQNGTMYINSSNNSSNTVVGDSDLKTKKQQYNSEANFETVYALYPRKMGRKAALRHFQASVDTEKDLNDINLAIQNYSAYLTKNKIEEQYIQHASTFFNNWKDWANDFHLKTAPQPKKGAAGREL